jgi:hypothetical protein
VGGNLHREVVEVYYGDVLKQQIWGREAKGESLYIKCYMKCIFFNTVVNIPPNHNVTVTLTPPPPELNIHHWNFCVIRRSKHQLRLIPSQSVSEKHYVIFIPTIGVAMSSVIYDYGELA